jgi:beta-galactosidase/beta-glucuronidase
VPFPVESALSGVGRMVGEANRLWYKRTFTIPAAWRGKTVLLHFGAVDWESTVWVNGREIASHRGGYDGFSVDITPALAVSGEQEVVVSVWDPTDAGTQPRGKQVRAPRGIWYTSTTGIWRTVWLEPVNGFRIEKLVITPDTSGSEVKVRVQAAGQTLLQREILVEVLDGKSVVASVRQPLEAPAVLKLRKPKLWSPDSPFLYGLRVTLVQEGRAVDGVESYFGMRGVSLGKDGAGFTRILLNGEPLFQLGQLDQGFWPDGLYTAPTDEALRFDIETMKALGFNTARKHVKIEPERWYYWCDKLGLIVWQDMPSGDASIGEKGADILRSPASGAQFETELEAMVRGLVNHPSIVMWVPYNEGWGQWDTARIVGLIRSWDPTRLVNNASGWADRGAGDVNDVHKYPGPDAPKPEDKRAAVLGEYGGLGLPIKGHTWQDEKNWGYKSFETSGKLTEAFLELQRQVRPLIRSSGLSAAIYTQTSDVEIEVNGLMTYDRALVKIDRSAAAAANRLLTQKPAKR